MSVVQVRPEEVLARLLPEGRREEISGPLLRWFHAEQRDLPWRKTEDPYAIWVSEIMLQQTQVATVVPYYELWMARFPTVRALAGAAEDDVLHAWQGLGYYSRARNLLHGARAVVQRHEGRVPGTLDELLRLPGVGLYTAGAIASIAYNVPAPIVDGNVIRVLTRLFALRGDPARAPLKRALWELAGALIPEGQANSFNPALMELGATVCTPVRPQCGSCPVADACQGRKLEIQEELPETAPRPAATSVHVVAGVVWKGSRVLLTQRRDDEDRWAGMWQFPNVEVQPGEATEQALRRAVGEAVGLDVKPGARAAIIRHSVTRYRITVDAFHCQAEPGDPRPGSCRAWSWVCPAQFGDYALPAAHRRIAQRLLREEGQLELGFHP